MVVKYAAGLNSLDYLAITRLDILDTFKELKICVGYKLNGKEMCIRDSVQIEQLFAVYLVLCLLYITILQCIAMLYYKLIYYYMTI